MGNVLRLVRGGAASASGSKAIVQPGEITVIKHDSDLRLFDSPAPAVQPRPLSNAARDLMQDFFRDKRSESTKRAYERSLVDFFRFCGYTTTVPTAAHVDAFLGQNVDDLALQLRKFKAHLMAAGKSEATVNNRLAAVRSLMAFAYPLGLCVSNGSGLVSDEKEKRYRDTRGIGVDAFRKLLKQPAKIHGKGDVTALRDEAMLRLLGERGLRNAEVRKLNVGDFSLRQRRVAVLGKGRGTQKEHLTISEKCALLIADYLVHAGHQNDAHGPLFRNYDHRPAKVKDEDDHTDRRKSSPGRRLTGPGLEYIVRVYGKAIGEPGLRPHGLRHTAITEVLELTNGNTRQAQRFSRHAKADTLTIYDDNRTDVGGMLTQMLSDSL